MKDWLKLKRYTHFSQPYQKWHIPFIRSYVSDPEKVVRHRFYPFIHYTIVQDRFRRASNSAGQKEKRRTLKRKSREIFYANHLDAQVFAYYSFLISSRLEEIYEANSDLGESVIAYRRIPFDAKRNKCNIDFAKEVFDFIKSSPKKELAVLCFDVSNFFDSLNHKILKKAWYSILKEENKTLPLDHYRVFKAITQFTYVEIGDLISEFSEFKIKKLQYLKKRDVSSFCRSGREFRERVAQKQLINFNKYDTEKGQKRDCGIPQGSPISATLSNLYMLEFDRDLVEWADCMDGLYRRYSDDILFICSPEDAEDMKIYLVDFIRETLLLEIQVQKTQDTRFSKTQDGQWAINRESGSNRTNAMPLSYLGFDFDGKCVRLRQKGVSAYYRKLKRTIRRRARYAFYARRRNENNENREYDDWIYRQGIYKSKSHLGAKKKRIDGKVYWGNYISYVNTASRIFKESAIDRQLKNHWKIIHRDIRSFERQYRLRQTPSRRKETVAQVKSS